MRICRHFDKRTKQCNLGISPMVCSGCSMFAVGSRRMLHQMNAEEPNVPIPGGLEPMINNSGVGNAVDETKPTISPDAMPELNVNEQQLLQSSAVTGGCGCRKK